MTFPSRDQLTILFGHPAYRVKTAFDALGTGVRTLEADNFAAFEAQFGEADVVVCSGFWRNQFLTRSNRLKFIQSISAGTDQYDRAALTTARVRLASAHGVNVNAVSDHAMALVLAIARRLPEARDNQARKVWRPMQSDHALREDELAGKTIVIVGLGRIGGRLAKLAKAFDMTVVGVRRSRPDETGYADEVHSFRDLHTLLPRADYVVLNCPLTDETRGLIDGSALALFKKSAWLVNTARGACVDETALISALEAGTLAGAALDTVVEEPLPATSPLWSMPNVVITPHTGGETGQYEANVARILATNLEKLWADDDALINGIV